MKVVYNEIDKKKCAALSQLMKDGHIRKGEIDDRSIRDVSESDYKDFERCHFFAGVGLWDYALNLALWPEGRRVWTGSCPCQPYSTAGRQKGKADDRHLWPEWERLIIQSEIPTVFGEQVASAISHGWLDDVYQGLEAQDYAVGSSVLSASAVGAPHKRERLFFVANAKDNGCDGRSKDFERERTTHQQIIQPQVRRELIGHGDVGDTFNARPQGHPKYGEDSTKPRRFDTQTERSAWSTGVWIDCPDGKQRLVEPGIPLLADGYSERVGLIHAAGDAIVPQVAAGFIQAAYEAIGELS